MDDTNSLKLYREIFKIYLDNKCNKQFIKYFLTSGDIEIDELFEG
ncbi:MAG: hypothetical protein AABZ74_15505 [Cyanobacteriota bacterium]